MSKRCLTHDIYTCLMIVYGSEYIISTSGTASKIERIVGLTVVKSIFSFCFYNTLNAQIFGVEDITIPRRTMNFV